jgi:hypothetical protein
MCSSLFLQAFEDFQPYITKISSYVAIIGGLPQHFLTNTEKIVPKF